MREDVLQHRTHVRFVLLSQVDYTLVIVSCEMWEREENDVSFDKQSTAIKEHRNTCRIAIRIKSAPKYGNNIGR